VHRNGARRVRREAARKSPEFMHHERGNSPCSPPYARSAVGEGPPDAQTYSAGACCPSVASLAGSLAVAGMPGRRGVFRVLARVSGIGGECFSWMGGRQQCGDRVAAHLEAGHAGCYTARTCQWSGTVLWPWELAAALKLASAISSCPARRAVGVAQVLLVA
jgi:hypothetical protein